MISTMYPGRTLSGSMALLHINHKERGKLTGLLSQAKQADRKRDLERFIKALLFQLFRGV